MLEDAATFDQATIFTLNLPQWVKRLPLDFSKGNGKGTTRSVSLCMYTKNGLDDVRQNDKNVVSVVSDKTGVYIPSPENQTMVELMGKGWTLASHSWSNTTTRLAGLIGFTRTSTGTALPFVQTNVCGPSLHLLLGLLHPANLATGSRRKLWTGPTFSRPKIKLIKSSKERYLLGQDKTSKFSG